MKTPQIIWVDSAENTVRATVNSYGKKVKFDNGGYRAGLVCGEIEAVWYNTQCPDQFAGECWATLKAVEFAKDQGFVRIIIRNDRISSFKASTKRGYKGSTYLWLAEKMATESGIEVEFDRCTSEENLADNVARREGAKQGIQPSKEKVATEKQIAESFAKIAAAIPVPAVTTTVNGRSDRGPEFQAWFDAHKNEWPAIRDTWKAEGLSSRQRDERLVATVKAWAATQPQFSNAQ